MLLLNLPLGLWEGKRKVRKAGGLKEDPQSPHQDRTGGRSGAPPSVDLPFHVPVATLLGFQLSFWTKLVKEATLGCPANFLSEVTHPKQPQLPEWGSKHRGVGPRPQQNDTHHFLFFLVSINPNLETERCCTLRRLQTLHFSEVGDKPRALCMLGKSSCTEPHPQPRKSPFVPQSPKWVSSGGTEGRHWAVAHSTSPWLTTPGHQLCSYSLKQGEEATKKAGLPIPAHSKEQRGGVLAPRRERPGARTPCPRLVPDTSKQC